MSVPANTNTSLVGDSLTASPGMSSFYWGNGLTGGKLRVIQNAGVGSEYIPDCLARIHNSYLATPPGLTGLSLGWVVLRIGTNDAANFRSLATVQPEYDALLAAILNHCERCIVMAVPAQGSGTPLPQQYSSYLSSVCAANPTRLTFVDDGTTLRSGDVPIGDFLYDGIHPNPSGTYAMGSTFAVTTNFASLMAEYTDSPLLTSSSAFPDAMQWVPNPMMAGTGGTVGTGFTGTLPDNWTIAREVFVQGACSIVADGDGRGPWIRIAITAGASADGATISIPLSKLMVTGNNPQTYEIALQVRTNALNTTAAFDFTSGVQLASGGYLCPRNYLLCFNAGTISRTVTLRSAFPREVTGWQNAPTFKFHYASQSNPASPGSFDIRCVGVTAPVMDNFATSSPFARRA